MAAGGFELPCTAAPTSPSRNSSEAQGSEEADTMSYVELPAEILDEFVHPDIHSLFQHYSDLYFDGELGHCSVEWSSGRMTR